MGAPKVYGSPGCGNCGAGLVGMCGGAGIFVSRKNLLRMAGVDSTPVSKDQKTRFIQNFEKGSDNIWSDVRFGCVAQQQGLTLSSIDGLYGWRLNAAQEADALTGATAEKTLPNLLHYINVSHMHEIHNVVKRSGGLTLSHPSRSGSSFSGSSLLQQQQQQSLHDFKFGASTISLFRLGTSKVST